MHSLPLDALALHHKCRQERPCSTWRDAFFDRLKLRQLPANAQQVRLDIRFRGRLSLPVRVDVATMVDAQLAKPAAWKPDQNPAQAEIENTRMIRHIQAR